MKKNRWLAILAASVLAASQITTAAFAASDVNGKVFVNGDEAWAGNSESSEMLNGNSGSVTNTEGEAAVTVSNSTGEEKGKDSLSFTVDGDVSSDNSTVTLAENTDDEEDWYYDDIDYSYTVTGVEVNIREPDKEISSVKDTVLEITGDVSAEGTIDDGGAVTGIQINAFGGKSQDHSVAVTADGDVKAVNGSAGNYAIGIDINTVDENDWGGDESETSSGSHTMTTKVTAGSVTANGGPDSDATGVDISADSDTAAQDITVDVKGDITVNGDDSSIKGIELYQGGDKDNSVNISVGGGIALDGAAYVAAGISLDGFASSNGNASANIDIKNDVTVKAAENSTATGVDPEDSVVGGSLTINIGGNVKVEASSDATGIEAPNTVDSGTAEIKVGGDVIATATGKDGSATAIYAWKEQSNGIADVLVGGNATASGADSIGIGLDFPISSNEEEESGNGSGSGDTSNRKPARIEVLGTVDGGEKGTDLLIWIGDCETDWVYDEETDDEYEVEGDPMTVADVKAALSGAIPEIVTHELKNGSIKAISKSGDSDNAKAALEALAEMTFYTVNYTTKVTDETGAEDNSLGTITITQYDGRDLEKKELRYDGSTAYVAKAGDVIKINVKVTKDAVSKTTRETVTGKPSVLIEESDTEIVTTTTTPQTTIMWQNTTSYEIDLDKLQIAGGKGVLKAETTETGEVVYTLEVTPVGGIDINVEALIKAITEKSKLEEIVDNIVDVTRVEKGTNTEGEKGQGEVKPEEQKQESRQEGQKQEEVKPAEEKQNNQSQNGQKQEEVKPAEEKQEGQKQEVKPAEENQESQKPEVKPAEEKHDSTNVSIGHRAHREADDDKRTGGWIREDLGWRYKNEDGSFVANSWALLPWGNQYYWYYFNSESYMLTGWQTINGKSYYLEPEEGKNQGHLWVNTMTPDGYMVDENGVRI